MKKTVLLLIIAFVLTYSSSTLLADLEMPESFWITYTAKKGSQSQIFIQQFDKDNWQEAIQVTDSLSYNTAPAIAVIPDGSLWVTWSGFDNINTSIYAKQFKDGEWSKEYKVSIPNQFEDSQPSIDIDSNGNPVIVWSGNNGQEDNILISFFSGSAWSNEAQINIKNQTPDVDPNICIIDDRVLVTWSGYRMGKYEILAAEKDSSSISFKEVDLNLPTSSRERVFPSVILHKNLQILFFTGHDLYETTLNKKDFTASKSPQKISLSKDFERTLKKLNVLNIQNFSISYASDEKINNSLKLSLILEKLKNPQQISASHSGFFHLFGQWLTSLFIFEKQAYAVTADKNTAFGDSITLGYKSTTGGYPARLANSLGQAVVNRGVGGEMTSSGVSRINSILKQDDPQRILIMGGTNDMNQGRSISSVIFNLSEMVNRSRNYGSTPYLATICPSNRKHLPTAQLNEEIKSTAIAMGVTNPDINGAFGGQVTEQYFIDDIHPNDSGYDIIALTFKNSISPPAPSSSSGGGGCGSIHLPLDGSGSGMNLSLIVLALAFLALRKIIRVPVHQ
ncbi:MAG: hypothetical protein KAI43_14355 [Candidatus Aureabacteria bacterium]|nr:hypothetical protein [Candidatus Auribacterota bacterium]